MGNIRIAALCAWLAAVGTAAAQAPAFTGPQPKELPPKAPAPTAEPAPVAASVELSAAPLSEIIWFRTDLLFWSLPSSRMPIPIVTTGNPADDCFAGAIGQPNTRVLFGNQDLGNTHTNGLRFTLGAWFDNAHDLGVEVSGFSIFQENHIFGVASDNTGNIPLYLSGFNTQLGREDSAIIADPIQQFGGAIKIRNDLNLWGTEVNALFNIRRGERFEWTLLSGLRYMELRESFSLSAVSRDLILNQQITLDDRFETTNQFLGYQLGSRMSWRYKRFLFDLTGKVALGGNEQTRSISGQSTSSGPDATNPGTFPGGFYAQPSNMGKNSDLQLAVMPALEMKLGFNITSGILFTVGYDLFYLNQTVRVANQIDRNLNLSQSAVLGTATPAAPLTPRRINDSSDFLVQGLGIGLEIRY